jgi:hypothetical protein
MSDPSPAASPTASAAASTASDAPGMARLTVHRSAPEDARQRQVILSLDGQQIATLLFGQQTTRQIPAGHHRLRANNTLVWKTVEFDAAPGDDLHVHIVNRAAPGMLALVALFGAGPMYVTMEVVKGAAAPSDASF